MTTGYEGRGILVTGANSGIGEAIAVAFQQTGATVFGLARRREALEAARARHPQIHWPRGGSVRTDDERQGALSRGSHYGAIAQS